MHTRLPWPWGFSRQEYWSGLPWPPPGDLPSPGIEPGSPELKVDSLLFEPPGKPIPTGSRYLQMIYLIYMYFFYLCVCIQCLFKKLLFIYFWLHWVFTALGRLSLVWQVGAILCCGTQVSHCGGFSCYRAQATDAWASVVAACGQSSCGSQILRHAGFSSCGSQVLEHRLGNCGSWA